MPILGVISSGISGHLETNSFQSIATVTVSSATPTISFNSIPATYTHLQIRGITRDARSVNVNNLNMQVGNGSIDTGSNYYSHYIDSDGSSGTATAGPALSHTSLAFMIEPGASGTATVFSAYIIDILDYANTNKRKTFRAYGGTDLNGSGNVNLCSGTWASNTAITNIQFFNNGNFNFVQYSSLALYGIKG